MNLDRRRFVQVAAAGIVAAIAYPLYRRKRAGSDADVNRPQLLAILGADRTRALGVRYRDATPSENSVNTLRAVLADTRRPRVPFHHRKSIDDLIRDDFVDGRTPIIDGWVLSVTEARQAALYSLSV